MLVPRFPASWHSCILLPVLLACWFFQLVLQTETSLCPSVASLVERAFRAHRRIRPETLKSPVQGFIEHGCRCNESDVIIRQGRTLWPFTPRPYLGRPRFSLKLCPWTREGKTKPTELRWIAGVLDVARSPPTAASFRCPARCGTVRTTCLRRVRALEGWAVCTRGRGTPSPLRWQPPPERLSRRPHATPTRGASRRMSRARKLRMFSQCGIAILQIRFEVQRFVVFVFRVIFFIVLVDSVFGEEVRGKNCAWTWFAVVRKHGKPCELYSMGSCIREVGDENESCEECRPIARGFKLWKQEACWGDALFICSTSPVNVRETAFLRSNIRLL